MATPTVLITGFEPYGRGHSIRLAQLLNNWTGRVLTVHQLLRAHYL